MKNKKGFTLIELLAIIVILAIIAVITVPIILNIIENSKKGAATDSAYGYKDAIEKFYASKLSIDSTYNIPDGLHTKQDFDNMGVTYSGKSPADNSFLRTYKNRVIQGCLQFDEYKVEFVDGKPQNVEKGECKTVNIIYTDTDESKSITLGDTVKIEEEEFYILDEPLNGRVKLLTKYGLNTNSRQDSVNYMNGKFADMSSEEPPYWAYQTGSSRYVKDEYKNNNYYVYTRDSQNYLYSYFENYKNYLIDLGATFVTDTRTLTLQEAQKSGCQSEEYSYACPDFMGGQDFWLGTAYDQNNMYIISEHKRYETAYPNSGYAYRPVIEIYESAITDEYTIKYDSRNNDEIITTTVNVGSAIGTLPPNPTKDKSTFEGWYTDPEYTEKVTTDTIPIGSTTYYAKYTLSRVEYKDSNNSGTINAGDTVKILDDEFYVVSSPSNGKVKLLTKYYLNTSGRQASSNYITNYKFADMSSNEPPYWAYQTGSSRYVKDEYKNNNYYVYTKDNKNYMYKYFNNYQTYLIGEGATFVIDVRAMSYSDATAVGCQLYSSYTCPTYMRGQNFWLGTAYDQNNMYIISEYGKIDTAYPNSGYAYRPLVEINESAFPN